MRLWECARSGKLYKKECWIVGGTCGGMTMGKKLMHKQRFELGELRLVLFAFVFCRWYLSQLASVESSAFKDLPCYFYGGGLGCGNQIMATIL